VRLIERMGYGLAKMLGRAPRAWTEPIAWALAAPLFVAYRRDVALANLTRAFPDWSPARRGGVAFASYRQMTRTLLEFLQMDRYGDDEIAERVEARNLEALDRAMGEGRGVVVLTGHLGNWEWIPRRVAAAGHRPAVVYMELHNPALSARMKALRGSRATLIAADEIRAALRWLRGGGLLGILMDQEPFPEDAVVAPFFGGPVLTHAGPLRLARLSGAAVFTVFARRVGPRRYRMRFDPFPLSESAEPERALAEDAAEYNARLEAAIRAAPEQWLWTHRRWKRSGRLGAAEAAGSRGPG
jgi:KDO2-lipid IV(A) lauroyltransferase